MAGVAQGVAVAAAASAYRHHEPVGFDDLAIGHLDPHGTRDQHGPVGHHLHPGSGHRFSARITISSSSRLPRGIRPTSSSHLAREDSTGPNGIHLEAITFASIPAHFRESNDCWTPESAECTSNRDPPSRNSFGADSHSGSRIIRPSTPAFQAHDGPAVGQISSVSALGGVGTYGGLDTTTSNGA